MPHIVQKKKKWRENLNFYLTSLEFQIYRSTAKPRESGESRHFTFSDSSTLSPLTFDASSPASQLALVIFHFLFLASYIKSPYLTAALLFRSEKAFFPSSRCYFLRRFTRRCLSTWKSFINIYISPFTLSPHQILSVDGFVYGVNKHLTERQETERLRGIMSRIDSYDVVVSGLSLFFAFFSRVHTPFIRCQLSRVLT